MSTQKPDSNPADIYRKLISLNQRQPVSRTTVHSAHARAVQYKGPQVKRTPLCVRIPTRDAWAEHKPEDKPPCLYNSSPSPSPYRQAPSPCRARPHTSCGTSASTSFNSSIGEDEVLPAPPPSPTRNSTPNSTEVYDVDMVTAWSSFDLKSYELTLQPPHAMARAKSAPIKQRRELQCNTATLLYDKQIHARQSEHKFRPSSSASRSCSSRASNQQTQSVLQSTFQSPQFQQRMVKFLKSPADFELLLQALKLERCVPRGASEAMLRKNLQSILATL